MHATDPLEVAIIGGGRQGRTICRALAAMRQVSRVHLVSRRGARGMHDWLAAEGLVARVMLHGKVDPVLWNADVRAAIVANRPDEHFTTARWLLENGKHVLVEKPFVASAGEARTLVDMADARHLVLAVGLDFFLASYVHYFRSVVHNQGHPHPVERTTVIWHEPPECRPAPASTPAETAARLMPNVLTLLTVIFGRHTARVAGAAAGQTHGAVRCRLAYGPHAVEVSLSCDAPAVRRVEMVTRQQRRFALEFTGEPGTVREDGRALPEDLLWDALPRPLPAGLAYFLAETREPQGTLPLLARDLMHIVEGTEALVARAERMESGLARVEPYLPAALAARTPHGVQERR